MMKIIRYLLVISVMFTSVVSANTDNKSCVVEKLMITKVGVDSIGASFYDNGRCGDYKITFLGGGEVSIIPDNATVKLNYADADPYTSSKIRSITTKDKDIIFNFDYTPQLSKYDKNKFTYILITPAKNYLAIENKPLNIVEEVNCDKSLGVVNIKTTYITKVNYGRFSKTASFLDLFDTSLQKNNLKSAGCNGALEYRYETSPNRLRLIFNSEAYKNLSGYHKDERSFVMTNYPKANPIYVVKFLTVKDNSTDNIDVVLSSGVVSRIDKLNDTEYAVEVDDNERKIDNLRYERKFSNSYILSISKQRAGKGDRFLIRVERGTVLTIDSTELGFQLNAMKVFSE